MFLVAGIPRASTTLVAKLISLTDNAFCYAGETHLIPFLHRYFEFFPCHPEKIDHIIHELNQTLTLTMLEAPRYNVSKGAHPGNLIFDESHVKSLIDQVRPFLRNGIYGARLFNHALTALENVLAEVSPRKILGEKTPDNLYALASFNQQTTTKSLIVIREPFGVLRSMDLRVKGNDPYSGVFGGGVESNIGIYLESMHAVAQINKHGNSQLVHFENLAEHPIDTVKKMYRFFGLTIDKQIESFLENGGNQALADKAPMYYQRLKLKTDNSSFNQNDLWKILNLTRESRTSIGYSDEELSNMGFDLSSIKFEGSVKNHLVPIFGFNVPDISPSRIWNRKLLNCWMKGRAQLVLYIKKIRSVNLTLNFISAYPENLLKDNRISLQVSANNAVLEKTHVSAGLNNTTVTVNLSSDIFLEMGNKAGYLMIDLEPEISYCPAAHSERNWDTRTLSFQLTSWSLKNA